jgi:tRNA (cytosine34-C5)-methyltransferase
VCVFHDLMDHIYYQKMINTGVKLFARNEAGGKAMIPYRICQDGLYCVQPFITKRVFSLTRDELLRLLCERDPPFFYTFRPDMSVDLFALELGCVILKYHPTAEEEPSFQSDIWLAGWRGHTSLSLLISKEERHSLLSRFRPVTM